MTIDLFGLKIGGNSKTRFEGKHITEYNIKKQELLDALGIDGKCVFIQFDLNTNSLKLKVEEE